LAGAPEILTQLKTNFVDEQEACPMLGEMIGETCGKRIVRRVLSSDPVKVEVTFEDAGKMLGIGVNGFGTYCSQVRPAC